MAGDASTTARCPNCARLERRIAELEQRVAQLEQLLEKATRAQKRQAAPFSKGTPKRDPKKPGRKPGVNYGPKAHRPLPEQKPDEIIDVPLPEQCPECGGQADEDHIDQQFQVEIPSQPIVRRFDIQGLLDEAFGISLSRGGAAQVVLRVADWRSGWTVCWKGTSRITATASFKSTWLGIAIRS